MDFDKHQPPARNSPLVKGLSVGARPASYREWGGALSTRLLVVCKVYINCHGVLAYILSVVSCSSGVPISMMSPQCSLNLSLARASMFTISSSSGGKKKFHSTTLPLNFIEISYRRNFEGGL